MFKISSGFSISTHTPPARRDIQGVMDTIESTGFLLTRLPRGVTNIYGDMPDATEISTHTPPARRDNCHISFGLIVVSFLLTRLPRGVTTGVL